MDPHEWAARKSERAILREWIYGKQIDLLWQGRMPETQEPRPMGPIRKARNRGLEDVLAMLDQRDREAPTTPST